MVQKSFKKKEHVSWVNTSPKGVFGDSKKKGGKEKQGSASRLWEGPKKNGKSAGKSAQGVLKHPNERRVGRGKREEKDD